MTELEIIHKFMNEFENDFIPSIVFEPDVGYQTNFRSGKKPSYAKRIGEEFIKHNIPFSSLYDIGHGKYDSTLDDSDAQKNYSEACKRTPNHIFLQEASPFKEQKRILLKFLDKIDFSLLFDNPLGETRFANEDTEKLLRFFDLLNDLKNAGLDKLHINPEITANVAGYYIRGDVSNPNIAISFIYNNFSFDEEFMKTTFKDSFFKHFTLSQKDTYDKLCCINNRNSIKCNYYELNTTVPVKEEQNIKKNKI